MSGGSGGITNCEDFGHFCVPIGECALTEKLDNFECTGVTKVCCSALTKELTCAEKFGVICNLDQECSGSEIPSLDRGSCCNGNCLEIETENECEKNSFTCSPSPSCGDNREEKKGYSDSCNFGDICCGSKPDEGSNLWLIISLVILIILVILAIIFRNQLKVFFFKRKSKTQESKLGNYSRPSGVMPINNLREMSRPSERRIPPGRSGSSRDKDFDETMRKLRDMSK